MGRMSQKAERAAWTAFVDGATAVPESAPSKYSNQRCGKYASKHEAAVAADLWALHGAGKIVDLQEQVRITLVAGNPPLKPIIYIADFCYADPDGTKHVLDAKGFKTPVYRLKKRLAALMLQLQIEEV